ARRHARPDLLDAAAAERAALYFRRPRDRDDLRADRRHRGGVRRRPVRARHADPEHELHHGRGGPVLGSVCSFHARSAASQPPRRRASARSVLGSLAEGRVGGVEKGRSLMRTRVVASALAAAALAASVGSALAQTVVRVGWCARTVTSAAAPYAIATKMGWFAQAGLQVQLVPLPGSTD